MLSQWVVYHKAKDSPKKWCTRKWNILPYGKVEAEPERYDFNHLEECRDFIVEQTHGCGYRIDRLPGDDTTIFEVWI